MAWHPEIQDGEIVLVEYAERSVLGGRFDLLMTDRQVAYSRSRTFRVGDAVDTVATPQHELRDVELRCESPWGLWLLSFLLFAAFAWYFQAALAQEMAPAPLSLALPAFGAACLIVGRSTWVLQFRARGRAHRIGLPDRLDHRTRYRIAQALRLAEELGNLAPVPAKVR